MSEWNPKSAKRRPLNRTNDQNVHQDEQAFEGIRKKPKISLTGYESDSSDNHDSDDNVDTIEKDEPQHANNDENDMFAVDEDETVVLPTRKALSANQELDYNQFNKENIEDINGPSEAGLYDDDNKEVQVEAFNIEEERKNGYFDKEGNYVETQKDEDDAIQDQDLWIDDVKNVEEVAASQKLAATIRKKNQKTLQETMRHYMIDEALLRLKYFLCEKETVMETMIRLNKLRKMSESSKEFIINSIELLSDLINILEQKGFDDVYSLKRSDVVKLLREESLGDFPLDDDYKTQLWNFKWFRKPQIVHGPYTNYQMQYWKLSYFKNSVAVRLRDEPDKPQNWLHIDSITFM